MAARRGYDAIGVAAQQSLTPNIQVNTDPLGAQPLRPQLALPGPRVVPGRVLSTTTTPIIDGGRVGFDEAPEGLQDLGHIKSTGSNGKPFNFKEAQAPLPPDPKVKAKTPAKKKGQLSPGGEAVEHVFGRLSAGVKGADWTGRNMSKAQFYAHLHAHG